MSAQRNRGASVIAFTPTQRLILLPLLLHQQTKKLMHSTDGDVYNKYVFVLMGVPAGVLSYSIHIQFFLQNQSLLSSIENQIFIKRVTEKELK